MNLGFLISFIIANIFQARGQYHSLFIIAACSLFISTILHIMNWHNVKDVGSYYATKFQEQKAHLFSTPFIIAACFLVTLYLMHHGTFASHFIYALFFAGVIGTGYLANQSEITYQRKIYAYMLMMGASIALSFIQGLMSTALADFVAYNTTQTLLGIHVTPSGVNLGDSAGVLVFGFILAKLLASRTKQNKPAIKPESLIASGLAFTVPAFLMIPLGIWVTNLSGHTLTPVYFPLIMMILTAAGEIGINTTNYSMAGALGKPQHQGFLTGYLFINIAVGVNLSGPFSNLIVGQYHHLDKVPAAQTNPTYFKLFIILAGIALITTLIYAGLRNLIGQLKEAN